ncbi:hypothetical protein O181_120429 [Austropuccinia psidii MF-1]|uniref:Uncharacterized protein n=1 Tax=Austropuccinia psidii MF-1 TaxID=1389203 RepID=A0A9Q3Q0D6_9BASI|nr:hypothetical protein [Austropuccinia psidii MF-1]
MISTLLTILTLAECPPNNTYPYACVVPSRHCLRSALLTLLTTLTLTECTPNMLPTPLILTLPYYIHSVRWLVGVHDERNRQNMLSGLLCQQDLRGNWSVYSQCYG